MSNILGLYEKYKLNSGEQTFNHLQDLHTEVALPAHPEEIVFCVHIFSFDFFMQYKGIEKFGEQDNQMRKDPLVSPVATNPFALSSSQHLCEEIGQVFLNICCLQESLLLAVANSN